MIYYIDVDETICHYPRERKYELAVPIKRNIALVNKLYDEGHRIVYWTARGATTGINWFYKTKGQLATWGAKHHELRMDKPHYDFLVDDKAITMEQL